MLAATTPACTTSGASSCTTSQMAAYDIHSWGTTLQSLLPGFTATVACVQPATAISGPVTCTVTINWVENAVAMGAPQSNLAALATPTYTLYVEP